jgi:hypothetical protein
MGTYIGQTASRSNEGFGDPFTGYQRVTSYNPYTVQSFLNFSTSRALPVSIVDFNALLVQSQVQVKWTVAQEINIDGYELQRSTNGRDFTTIASLQARNATGVTTYTQYDAAPVKGNNYYRVKVIEKGGAQVSKVVMVKKGLSKHNLSVVQFGNTLNVHMQGIAAGDCKLSVINSNGQLVQSVNFVHNGEDGNKAIDLKSAQGKGIYSVVLQSASTRIAQSILIQ